LTNHPDAAVKAIFYYKHSIAKKKDIPFKPLVTEKAIAEESKEIENILSNGKHIYIHFF